MRSENQFSMPRFSDVPRNRATRTAGVTAARLKSAANRFPRLPCPVRARLSSSGEVSLKNSWPTYKATAVIKMKFAPSSQKMESEEGLIGPIPEIDTIVTTAAINEAVKNRNCVLRPNSLKNELSRIRSKTNHQNVSNRQHCSRSNTLSD